MQIYKLFGSLQYKVVKISHTLGDFYNSAGFTYINNTKKAAGKSQQPKRNGSNAPKCSASKFLSKRFLTKISSPTKISFRENCIKRGILRLAKIE